MTPPPRDDEPFFIGWADMPAADRRFFLRAGLGLTAAAGTLGFGLAALQAAPGPGQWDPDAVRDWHGVVSAEPYAMLRTLDLPVAAVLPLPDHYEFDSELRSSHGGYRPI